MVTHNVCLYKEADKKYTGCNLKTTKLLVCALIGVCAVIRLNRVFITWVFIGNHLIEVLVMSIVFLLLFFFIFCCFFV